MPYLQIVMFSDLLHHDSSPGSDWRSMFIDDCIEPVRLDVKFSGDVLKRTCAMANLERPGNPMMHRFFQSSTDRGNSFPGLNFFISRMPNLQVDMFSDLQHHDSHSG